MRIGFRIARQGRAGASRPMLRLLLAVLLFSLPTARTHAEPAAELALLELTEPGAAFVWQAANRVAALPLPDLAATAGRYWKARRDAIYPAAESLVTVRYADLAPQAAAEKAIALLREDAATGAGSALERDAAQLWNRLARRDWKAARALLAQVPGESLVPRFWQTAAVGHRLSLEQLRIFIPALDRSLTGPAQERALFPAVWNAVTAHGWRATQRTLATTGSDRLRKQTAAMLRELKERPPFEGGPPGTLTPPADRTLRRLLALDSVPGDGGRFPFPLHAAVSALPPEEAAAAAEKLAAAPGQPGHWLGWMLFMRAATAGLPDAARLATETGNQSLRASHAPAVCPPPLPMDNPGALATALRAMESPEARRYALESYFLSPPGQEILRQELGSPIIALAHTEKLPAIFWRPALCRAAASGAAEAALRAASGLSWEPAVGRDLLRLDILRAWALADLPAFTLYTTTLTNPDEITPAQAALAFAQALR